MSRKGKVVFEGADNLVSEIEYVSYYFVDFVIFLILL